MKLFLLLLTVMGAALFSGGCRSELYYRDKAVGEAREYVLENAPELNAEQRDHVRFTQPVLLYDPKVGGKSGTFLTRTPGQICVTWLVPGSKAAYMVVGFSDSRMMDWSPNRLIRRTFPQDDQSRLGAIDKARQYIFKGIYINLSADSGNVVRFENPEIYHSNFTPETSFTGEDREAFIKSLAQKPQYALVWKSPDEPELSFVVFGYSDPDLNGWTANSGGIYENADLAGKLGAKFEEAAE
ncbi:MAG: hypothetical protein PHI85_05875 [Victivallaceae bacterium]|nr:hypothetical protein [Victivallaceae bacterium]